MDADWLLLMRCKRGDEAAAESFVQKYYADILRYCAFHSASRQDAEDLTQETFARFFAKLSDYRHQDRAKNYLYTIAANLCKNAWARRTPQPAAEEQLTAFERAATDTETALTTHLLLEQALAALPPEQREVVILHYYQGLKLREIAEILAIGLPLVKYRLRQAKQHLAAGLREEDTP